MAAAAFRPVALAIFLAGCTTVVANQSTFDNSKWQVVAIDGRATPADRDYLLQFEAGRIGGRFGCNHFGGNYEVSGKTMRVSGLASTMMGCPEPAAGFESKGFAILRNPMDIRWHSGQRATFSSSAGSIDLELMPPAP